MKTKIYIFLFIAFTGINGLNAQNQWISFTKETPEEPTVTLQQSNTSAVIFNVQTPGMYSEDITVDENLYQRLQLPGQRRTRAEGEPEMPFIRQLIAVPECEDITITVQTNSPMFFENYMVYPAPAYELVENPDGTFYLQEVFTKNDSIYNLDIFMPQVTAEITDIGYMRSQRIAEVLIYPIQFNPVTGELQVFTDIDITLDFTDAISDISVNTGIFSNLVDNVLLNYTEGGIGASINDRSDEAGTVSWVEVTDTSGEITADYLVVAASEFL